MIDQIFRKEYDLEKFVRKLDSVYMTWDDYYKKINEWVVSTAVS